MKEIKIAFLLGSGTSLCAGAPTTDQLTDSLTNSIGRNQQADEVLLIKDFINYSKFYIKEYYEWLDKPNFDSERMVSYESIYYLIWQLWNCKSGVYDNPAIFKLYKEIQNSFEPQILYKDFLDDEVFKSFLEKVLRYIENTVSRKLELILNNDNFLKIIQDAYENEKIKKVEIFSLNHDTLIEQILDKKKIKYSDGFKEDDLKIKIWNKKSFNNKSKINLYKLHGSINWYQFYRKDKKEWFVGSVPTHIKNLDHIKDTNNSNLLRIKRRGILVGTFNKIFNYLADVFILLNFKFYETLSDFNYFVISGYSFGDKGINLYIRRFMNSGNNKKLVIIDPDGGKLGNKARGMIADELFKWELTKKMEIIHRSFEETKLQDVLDALKFLTKK